MDSSQRFDEKNGIICLVIMLTPEVIVIKMSKMALLSADNNKKSVAIWVEYLSASKDLI